MQNKCKQTFKDYLKRRKEHPLSEGLYKLAPLCLGMCQDWKTIALIHRRLAASIPIDPTECLGSCVGMEWETWISELPIRVAEDLGFYFIPAIKALRGDGLPQWYVSWIQQGAQSESQTLLSDLERVRLHWQRARISKKMNFLCHIHALEKVIFCTHDMVTYYTERASEALPKLTCHRRVAWQSVHVFQTLNMQLMPIEDQQPAHGSRKTLGRNVKPTCYLVTKH